MEPPTDQQLWEELCAAERALAGKRYAFVQRAIDKASILRRALATPAERGTALRFLLAIEDDALKRSLLPDLVRLASVAHSDVVLGREAILSIDDRQAVLDEIEPLVRDVLEHGDDEHYLRVAELYSDLDEGLLQSHLERCRYHPDPEVREVPGYFEDRD